MFHISSERAKTERDYQHWLSMRNVSCWFWCNRLYSGLLDRSYKTGLAIGSLDTKLLLLATQTAIHVHFHCPVMKIITGSNLSACTRAFGTAFQMGGGHTHTTSVVYKPKGVGTSALKYMCFRMENTLRRWPHWPYIQPCTRSQKIQAAPGIMPQWESGIKGVAVRLWVKVSDNFGYGWEDPFMQRWKTYSDENVVNGPFCQPTWKKWTWNLMSSWRRSWLFPRNTQERQKQASTVEKHVWHLWLHWFEVIKCQLKRHH